MKKIDLNTYKPIISDKEVGESIYSLIKKSLSENAVVEIDVSQIKSMATFCSKQIFGRLYVELGPKSFFEQVKIRNASDDIKSLIKIGIQSALDDK